MPDLPISRLPQAGSLTGAELFATVQDGTTKYVALSSVATSLSTNYGLFNQTGSSIPVIDTVAESNLLDGGIGTLSVPANAFQKGDAYHAILTGHLSAANNNTLRIRIKSNGSTLADTGTITMSGATNKNWKMEIYFSINEIGGAGAASISTGGTFMYTKDASTAFEGSAFSTETTSSFSTLVDNTLVITAQWGTASTNNAIYSQIFTLKKTY